MHYYSTKLCKRAISLLTLTLVILQLMGCGQRGPLTLPESKPAAESKKPTTESTDAVESR